MTATEIDIPRYETLRVVNVGDRVFEGWFNRHLYRIDPGAAVFVPRGFVNIYLGDWELDDQMGRVYKRREDWERLQLRYSYTDPKQWEASVPRMEVFDLDGNKLTTILEDPEGVSVNVHETTIAEHETLQGEVTRLRNQLDNVMQLLNRQEALDGQPEQLDNIEADVMEDEPSYAKPRGRSGAGERARAMREQSISSRE